jgi:hypothetical protein
VSLYSLFFLRLGILGGWCGSGTKFYYLFLLWYVWFLRTFVFIIYTALIYFWIDGCMWKKKVMESAYQPKNVHRKRSHEMCWYAQFEGFEKVDYLFTFLFHFSSLKCSHESEMLSWMKHQCLKCSLHWGVWKILIHNL